MAFQYVTRRSSKTGRGIAQVPQLDDAGQPIIVDGKPLIGNEQFQHEAIVLESAKSMTLDDFFASALEACGGDENTLKEDWVTGANHRMRLAAGGSSPAEKAARGLVKTLGCSYDEALALVAKLKK